MGGAELAGRRLAVHEKPAARRQRMRVRGLGAVAAAFFTDDEEHADTALTRRAEALGRMKLCGEDALRIAAAAPMEPAAFDPAREESAARSRNAWRTRPSADRASR